VNLYRDGPSNTSAADVAVAVVELALAATVALEALR